MFEVYESRKHLVIPEIQNWQAQSVALISIFGRLRHIMHNIMYIVNERVVLPHMPPTAQARSMVASFSNLLNNIFGGYEMWKLYFYHFFLY